MTQTQFLLMIIATIPFANCLLMKLCAESPSIINFINRLLPILFLTNAIGLYGNLKSDRSYLMISEAIRGISLGFAVDEIAVGFLFLLSFFWLIFVFYYHRFSQFSTAKNTNDFKFFFILTVAFLNLVFISKNLLTTLFFYNCLVLLCHFFAVKFLHKNDTKFSRFFTFLLYLESIFFFLAIVATYKFTAQIEFIDGGIIPQNFDQARYSLLLALYLGGLFLSVLLPCYLLYRNINLDPLVIYILFFLAYGFSGLYIFIKLLNFVFGFQGFSLIVFKIGFEFFEWIFLLNIGVASVLLVLNKGLKSSFFYLFFQQFLFALFSIILFATYSETKIYISLFSFLFSITLIFLCISNFILHLNKAKNKSLAGLFHNLPITSVLFIFGVFNLIGIIPAIGIVEKFFLIKIIFQKKLLLSGIILLVNLMSLGIFLWRIFYPFHQQESQLQKDDFAKEIDFDSGLILTALITAITMFLGLIFFPSIINFFNGL
jgi:formate hydrogenlyase subunit 3/multisubunit Na+/H+ antiporter MnhD subunit